MKIIEGKSLADFTTFRVGGKARFFCAVENKENVKESVYFAQEKNLLIFILGGGSNILVSDKGFDGLVVKMDIKGIEKVESPELKVKSKNNAQARNASSAATQDERRLLRHERSDMSKSAPVVVGGADQVLVRAGAGENWDDFVGWAVDNGYGGLENLSLIPGTLGAAPVQNIGAYGVEVGNLIESVEVFDMKENTFKNFTRKECSFSYRDSIFKKEKNRYVITSVLFKLEKDAKPDISYKDLKEYFNNNQEPIINDQTNSNFQSSITNPSIPEVRQAVIAIRTAKLPDLRKVGTAGSFFKNPILSKEKYLELKEKYSELPNFPEPDGRVKIPLAWIIDKVCGLKGKKYGKAGIHETQALVIVNQGGATYEDVEKVASEVERAVKEKTGIDIEREVIMV
jgi:UDP-N-acetylmuramate dehydrogenase